MDNLARLFNPDNPNNNAYQYTGFLAGIILAIDDPLHLGRIQVSVPLIEQNKPLPNGDDGWIPCMQRFSGAESPGGSFDPLYIGDQVILLPQAGDLRSLIAIGVLPSKIDPPSPYVDRVKKIHGSHTPGGSIELHDDVKSRSLKVYPSGLREKIDEGGNKIIETKNGARIFLGSDGKINIENQKSFYSLSEDGNISIGNDRSSFGIDKDGRVALKLADSSEIEFSGFGVNLSGQKDEIARLSTIALESLAGVTGIAVDWVSRLRGIVGELSLNNLSAIYQLDELLEQMIRGIRGIAPGISALQELSQKEPAEIGEKTVAQIDLFKNLNLSEMSDLFADGIDIDATDIEGSLSSILEDSIFRGSNPDWDLLKTTITASPPERHLEIVLATLFPDLFDTVIGKGLHRATNFLNSLQRKLDDLNLDRVVAVLDIIGQTSEEGSISIEIEKINTTISNIPLPVSIINVLSAITKIKLAIARMEILKQQVKTKIVKSKDAIASIEQLRQDETLAIEIGKSAIDLITKTKDKIPEPGQLLLKVTELERLTTALLEMQQIDEIPDLSNLPTLLKLLQKYYEITSIEEIIDAKFNRIEEVRVQIEEYTNQVTAAVIIPALLNLLEEINALCRTKDNLIELDKQLPSSSKGGAINANREEVRIGGDSGKIKGEIIVGQDRSILSGPGGNRGLGGKVITESEFVSIEAPGGDSNLGAKIYTSNKAIELKCPGADLGLGVFFHLNQESAFFYAPGGKLGIGSSWQINQEEINLYAPGGKLGIGSAISLEQESVTVSAPGIKGSGSKLTADISKLGLYAPGGEKGAGSRIVVEPDRIMVKCASLLGSYATFKDKEIEIAVPTSLSTINLRSDRINVSMGLNANISLTNSGIFLSSFGHFFTINGAGVFIDGVPLIPGGDLW